MPTQVALITDSLETRTSFAAVVAEAPEIDLVGTASSTLALTSLVLENPELDVVMVDADLADPPAMEVVRELGQNAPLVAVVVIGNSTTSLASVVAAGGRAMVTLPLSLQEVQSQLEHASAWSRSLRQHISGDAAGARGERGSVISLAGAKGGVGVSVLATVLAKEAAAVGESVCLVDLDLAAGDLAYLCAVSPRRNIADLAGLVGDLTIRGIREVAVEVPAGFVLVAAPDRVEQAEDVSGTAVRQMLNELRRHFSVIIVDTGSVLDDARAVALEVADEAVLVADCELISIRAGRRAVDAWARLNVREPDRVRLVVNRSAKRREVQPELVSRLIRLPLTRAVPDLVDEVEEPVNSGSITTERMPGMASAASAILSVCGISGRPTYATKAVRRAPSRAKRRLGVAAQAEQGQSAVELPVFVVLFLMAFLACVQAVVFGLGHVVAGNAANEAARTAAVGAGNHEIAVAAERAMGDFKFTSSTSVNRAAKTVTVSVEVPKLYGWLPDVLQTATATSGYTPED